MQRYKSDFIRFALDRNVLLFGDFELKSGQRSPYFFNSGLFNTGACLARLGDYYTAAIEAASIEFDMLFGPAYKGIPLVAALSTQMYNGTARDVPWSFNRKEAKDHGEAGTIVGAPLNGRVLTVDDVISAGTSTRESVKIITEAGATAVGLVIALDREERGLGERSAVQEVEHTLDLRVAHIISLGDLVEFLASDPDRSTDLKKVEAYREEYGV